MVLIMKNSVLVFLTLGYSLCCGKECPDFWTVYGSSCYLFGHQKLSFFSAESYCNQHKGRLVHVNDVNENSFIREHLRDMKATNWWIGLTDDDTENTWKWYGTNEISEYTDWAPGQPDDYHSNEDCAEFDMRPGYHERWNDEPCSALFQPICERPIDDCTMGIVG